jgi:hypothetical protein
MLFGYSERKNAQYFQRFDQLWIGRQGKYLLLLSKNNY